MVLDLQRHGKAGGRKLKGKIIDPPVPKDITSVCLFAKLFFSQARGGVFRSGRFAKRMEAAHD